MIRNAFVGAAGIVWLASTAAAQPQQPAHSFEELERQVVPGETIYVVDPSDQETKGRLLTLSDVTLTMAVDRTRRQFVAQDVTRIDRRHRDSVRNGLLIGAAAGALAGYALGKSLDSPRCPRAAVECGQGVVVGTVGGAFWGAVSGWLADTLVRKRETIYQGHGVD